MYVISATSGNIHGVTPCAGVDLGFLKLHGFGLLTQYHKYLGLHRRFTSLLLTLGSKRARLCYTSRSLVRARIPRPARRPRSAHPRTACRSSAATGLGRAASLSLYVAVLSRELLRDSRGRSSRCRRPPPCRTPRCSHDRARAFEARRRTWGSPWLPRSARPRVAILTSRRAGW
jgi:hypothetical protein